MSRVVIGDPRGDGDLEQFAAVDAESFAQSREHSLQWLLGAKGKAIVRLARSGDDVVGGYMLVPAGQFFGGRSVPVACVEAVSVHPTMRQRGIAGELMRDLVAVAHEQGAALAPLHAATMRLYRRWGWEVVDRGYTQTVETRALSGLAAEGLAVHSPDPASVEQLRRGYLSRYDGPLDRPDWWLPFEWDVGEGGEHKYSYGWSEADVLTGFLRYQQSRPSGPWMHIDVRELIASTGNAMRGLLSLLAGHEAQSPQVVFRHSSLPPRSDLLYLIPDADRAISIQGRLCWMQRIVDLREAVLARGWATHANTEVELEVVDPVRESRERVVLQLSEGHGYVSPGGNGNVHCDVGALSAWYSGTLRASDAERLGLFRGRADDIAVMDTLIGDRQPWMPDFF